MNVEHLSDCEPYEFGSVNIGPWTDWQGNFDADLMIVGQEWGGSDNYKGQCGCDRDRDPSNQNLVTLVSSIGRAIELPTAHQRNDHRPEPQHYFTNALLCLRIGRSTKSDNREVKRSGTPPEQECFLRCGREFLRPQIDLVKPSLVVTLGLLAYTAALSAYGLEPKKSMKEAFTSAEADRIYLDGVRLIPLYHCGKLGTLSRKLEQQIEDWRLVRDALQVEKRNLKRPSWALLP